MLRLGQATPADLEIQLVTVQRQVRAIRIGLGIAAAFSFFKWVWPRITK